MPLLVRGRSACPAEAIDDDSGGGVVFVEIDARARVLSSKCSRRAFCITDSVAVRWGHSQALRADMPMWGASPVAYLEADTSPRRPVSSWNQPGSLKLHPPMNTGIEFDRPDIAMNKMEVVLSLLALPRQGDQWRLPAVPVPSCAAVAFLLILFRRYPFFCCWFRSYLPFFWLSACLMFFSSQPRV